MDPDRARQLYVSKDPKDQPDGTDYQRDIDEIKGMLRLIFERLDDKADK